MRWIADCYSVCGSQGAAVLRMLSDFLSEPVFKQGLSVGLICGRSVYLILVYAISPKGFIQTFLYFVNRVTSDISPMETQSGLSCGNICKWWDEEVFRSVNTVGHSCRSIWHICITVRLKDEVSSLHYSDTFYLPMVHVNIMFINKVVMCKPFSFLH